MDFIKNNKIVFSSIFIIIVFLFALIPNNQNKVEVKFNACIDGDTAKIIIGNNIETVRFLAIDTPESVHPTIEDEPFGDLASEFTCNQLKRAKIIMLEFDSNSDRYDKYDRLLAWVFVDDTLLQEKLVSIGYAKTAYLYDDYKYTKILLKEEQKAKEKKAGIWYNE